MISAATLLVGAAAVQAQTMSATPDNNPLNRSSWFNSEPDELFRPKELSLDVFAAASGDDRHHNDDYGYNHHRDGRGGGGGGLEYFFCRYIGVEAESFALANEHNTESALGGNLVLRLPIGQTGLAPYIFGGGGSEWTYRSEGYSDAGAGLEYRFNKAFSIFADGRAGLPTHTRDYGMGRFGVKFIF
jgi:hypothetical protein